MLKFKERSSEACFSDFVKDKQKVLSLLSDFRVTDKHINSFNPQNFISAPVFTERAGVIVDRLCTTERGGSGFKQYGLLGHHVDDYNAQPDYIQDPKMIFLNGDAPWSSFICGVQGSGKSHTLSCMMENLLYPSEALGALPCPLTGLVFHYDQHSSISTLRPCEAAYLASAIPVTVLVSPTNLVRTKKLYSTLVADGSANLTVKPFKLKEEHLNVERMLTLMSVDSNEEHTPLYMVSVLKVLRDIAAEQKPFKLSNFQRKLALLNLTPAQKAPLSLRMDILESFLQKDKLTESWDFGEGNLVVVDLSDPFVDAGTACALFNICTGIFLEEPISHGRVIALDEAHKYMTGTAASETFTGTLLSIIRQQRHLATRVIVSTQEPTIAPQLLDLCNISIVHRFASPEWLDMLYKHLAGAAIGGSSKQALMHRIMDLEDGEALLFAPRGIVTNNHEINSTESGLGGGGKETLEVDVEEKLVRLSDRHLKIKIRKRVTVDGGKSVMATRSNGLSCFKI